MEHLLEVLHELIQAVHGTGALKADKAARLHELADKVAAVAAGAGEVAEDVEAVTNPDAQAAEAPGGTAAA